MPVYPKSVPPSAPAKPQPFQWVWPVEAGWGVLQIGRSVYVLHEHHYEDPDGRVVFCVRLKRRGAECEYQVTPNRDGDLACDCADATYRDRECKHVIAVRDAYAQLDRDRRLSDFLADDDPVVCPLCNGQGRGDCVGCLDNYGLVPYGATEEGAASW
jgi:hypothetical protein